MDRKIAEIAPKPQREAARAMPRTQAVEVAGAAATSASSERMVDFILVPIKDESGQVIFLVPTGTDITDRKRAEAERQKFITLVENSTDFIGMCDLEGVPFFVNRAGLEMVGLDGIEEARHTPVRDFFFAEDQARIMDEFFPSVLEKGHGETEVRFRHFRTGEARWMAYKVFTLTSCNAPGLGYS